MLGLILIGSCSPALASQSAILASQSTTTASQSTTLGDHGYYDAVRVGKGQNMPFTRPVQRNAVYGEHPLHELAKGVGPGIRLDAHSKALLRLQPALPLVAQIQDSIYVSKPGWPLVQLVVDGNIRRTNLIPDSLFLVPEDRYIYGLAVTRDLILGTLSRYTNKTSRIIGVFPMEVAGNERIAILLSHDYLTAQPDRLQKVGSLEVLDGPLNRTVLLPKNAITPAVSIAVFTTGLIFRDLIRLDLERLGINDPLPIAVGDNAIKWKSVFGEEIGFVLQRTPKKWTPDSNARSILR